MKNKLIGIAFAFVAIQLGIGSYFSGNVMEGLMALSAFISCISYFSLPIVANILYCLPLVSVSKSECQRANPGGIRKILICACDDFTAEWPLEINIDPSTGRLLTVPPLKAGKGFAEVEFTDDGAKFDYAKEGDDGHQSYKYAGECKVSGYEGGQWLALRKLLNMKAVVIAVHGNREWVIYGNSENGLSSKESHSTGLKGGDRNEIIIKMDQEGLEFAPPILDDRVIMIINDRLLVEPINAFSLGFSDGFN